MQAILLTDDGEAMLARIIAHVDARSALELVEDLPVEQRDALPLASSKIRITPRSPLSCTAANKWYASESAVG
jgi:hypothetical protein